MLEKIKLALRRSHDELNGEIEDTINACYKDMQRVGIKIFDASGNVKDSIKNDALILECIKLYARWKFNFENAAERYQQSYEKCRDGIALDGDYNEE